MSGPESLRAAGRALLHWQRRQEVNTNNLANVETAGFRAQRVFSRVMDGGVPTVGTSVDPTRGDLRKTESPLDLALASQGHFVVQSPEGERPVRSGSFTLDGDGQIVDPRGWPLLGESGPLVLPPGPVEIDSRGGVTVNGDLIGRIRVVSDRAPSEGSRSGAGGDSGDGVALAGTGPGGFAMSLVDGAGEVGDPVPEELIDVRQGFLEGSNVSALDSLIEMTTIQRSYEAVQNSVRTLDSVMETVANRLGRVQ